MPVNFEKIPKAGTTTGRKAFWDTVHDAVLSSRKIAGRHVIVDEHQGECSIISVDDTSGRRPVPTGGTTGACCISGACSIQTSSDCIDSGGVYLGDDTTCEGIDCTIGACCYSCGDCNCECSETTEAACIAGTPDGCSAAWSEGTSCGSEPDPFNFCCQTFGFGCNNSCYDIFLCCCEGSIVCSGQPDAESCNASCDPAAGVLGALTTTCDPCETMFCWEGCCVDGVCLLTPLYGSGTCADLGGTSTGIGVNCDGLC